MINKIQLEKYCCEDITKIQNYAAANTDTTQMWDCHHKLEMFYTRQELKDMHRYHKVPSRELVIVTKKQHWWWPHKGRALGSEKMKGNKNGAGHSAWNKGLTMPEDFIEKNRKAHLGKCHTSATKAKVSKAMKNMSWWNNGVKNVRARECPEGFVKGRIKRKHI